MTAGSVVGASSTLFSRISPEPHPERGPIHIHMLFLDGVYADRHNRPTRLQRVKAPDKSELENLVQLISQRGGRCLERRGLLEQLAESAWLDPDLATDTDAMPQLRLLADRRRAAAGAQGLSPWASPIQAPAVVSQGR